MTRTLIYILHFFSGSSKQKGSSHQYEPSK